MGGVRGCEARAQVCKGVYECAQVCKGVYRGVCVQVTISVDGILTTTGYTQEDFTMLGSDDFFYVGGSPNTADLPGSPVSNNFMAASRTSSVAAGAGGDARVTLHGALLFHCDPPPALDPSPSPPPRPTWRCPPGARPAPAPSPSISAPRSPTGSCSSGRAPPATPRRSPPGAAPAAPRFPGAGAAGRAPVPAAGHGRGRAAAPRQRPQGHRRRVVPRGRAARRAQRLGVGEQPQHAFLASGDRDVLDVGPSCTWGGSRGPAGPPRASRALGRGAAPRLRGLRAGPVRGRAEPRRAGAPGLGGGSGVAPLCARDPPRLCASAPCRNGGTCREGWNRFVCDCRGTGYLGPRCETEAAVLSYDGSMYLKVQVPGEQTEAEDVSLRFMSPRAFGLVLATTSRHSADTLRLELDGGRMKLTLNLDCVRVGCHPSKGPETLFAGQRLDDNEWHSVRVARRGRSSSSPWTTSPSKDSCRALTPAWSSTTSRPASSPSAASWPWSRPTSWAT
ncbi:neurexin-2-like [Agelaius phoeniceus]|uniref:neurexin-2-like n=1 Tax=Agelaius phoeniceus TaxID=39638 RepID=UPI004054F829